MNSNGPQPEMSSRPHSAPSDGRSHGLPRHPVRVRVRVRVRMRVRDYVRVRVRVRVSLFLEIKINIGRVVDMIIGCAEIYNDQRRGCHDYVRFQK